MINIKIPYTLYEYSRIQELQFLQYEVTNLNHDDFLIFSGTDNVYEFNISDLTIKEFKGNRCDKVITKYGQNDMFVIDHQMLTHI